MPQSMTPASAMAAAALGMDGTGWDEYLTKYMLKADPHSAKNAALTILSGRYDYMEAVAEELQEKGSIGQADVENAHNKVERRRRGIWDVQVQVVDEKGKVKEFGTQSVGDTVMIRNEWVSLATPANLDKNNQEAT